MSSVKSEDFLLLLVIFLPFVVNNVTICSFKINLRYLIFDLVRLLVKLMGIRHIFTVWVMNLFW